MNNEELNEFLKLLNDAAEKSGKKAGDNADLIIPHSFYRDVEYVYDGWAVIFRSKKTGEIKTGEIPWNDLKPILQMAGMSEMDLVENMVGKGTTTMEFTDVHDLWHPGKYSPIETRLSAKKKDTGEKVFLIFYEKWNPVNRLDKKPLLKPMDTVHWKEKKSDRKNMKMIQYLKETKEMISDDPLSFFRGTLFMIVITVLWILAYFE